MPNKPFVTLFSVISLDHKIALGKNSHWLSAPALQPGLYQIVEIAQTIDYWILTTAHTIQKVGFSNDKIAVPFNLNQHYLVLLDIDGDLSGKTLVAASKTFYQVLVYSTQAYKATAFPNVTFIKIKKFDLNQIFTQLVHNFNVDYLTILADTDFNTAVFKANVVDRYVLVQVPIMVNDIHVPTIFWFDQIMKDWQTFQIQSIEPLLHSYLCISYYG